MLHSNHLNLTVCPQLEPKKIVEWLGATTGKVGPKKCVFKVSSMGVRQDLVERRRAYRTLLVSLERRYV